MLPRKGPRAAQTCSRHSAPPSPKPAAGLPASRPNSGSHRQVLRHKQRLQGRTVGGLQCRVVEPHPLLHAPAQLLVPQPRRHLLQPLHLGRVPHVCAAAAPAARSGAGAAHRRCSFASRLGQVGRCLDSPAPAAAEDQGGLAGGMVGDDLEDVVVQPPLKEEVCMDAGRGLARDCPAAAGFS